MEYDCRRRRPIFCFASVTFTIMKSLLIMMTVTAVTVIVTVMQIRGVWRKGRQQRTDKCS